MNLRDLRLDRIPDYLRYDLAECRRLTRSLACLDNPGLFCAWNCKSQTYEVWGPSQIYGWAYLTTVEGPDGRPAHPDVYAMMVLADLRARDRDPNMKGVLERNAARFEQQWHAEMDEAGEAAKYVAKAVAQELVGAVRYGVMDVFLGLRNAMEGRSKGEPVGQRIFIPGVRG